MSKPSYPTLYQINTRVWLTELSRQLGRHATLDDIPDAELDRIAKMGFDPGVIKSHVVGDEIEHQLQSVFAQSLTQAGQRGVPPEILLDRVPGNCETRAGDVFFAQVG